MTVAQPIELTEVTGRLRVVDPATEPDYGRLTGALANATPFHGKPWALTLIRAYGHRPFYHLLETDSSGMSGNPQVYHGEAQRSRGRVPASDSRTSHFPLPASLSALCPLMEVSSRLTGRRGVALPFSDFCPPLRAVDSCEGEPERLLASIWPRMVDLGRQRGWRSIELRGGPAPVAGVSPSISYFGHELDLGGGETDLFNRFQPSVRRAIRKAQQSEVRVELGHALDALHDYYALHARTRRRHGLPPQPFRFFLRLHDEIISTGNGFIALARVDGRAIAGAVFLHAGRSAVFKYGASDPVHQSLRANDLLFWETIRRLAADGFATLHFGRTDLEHEGLRRFKLGWGTRETAIHYYRYDLRADRFVSVPDRVDGWHNALFERLPIPVNRFLGAFAYRHLD